MIKWLAQLFPHKKPVRYALIAFVLLAFAAYATECHAEDIPYVRAEVGSQVLRGATPALGLTFVWPHAASDLDVECGLLLVGGRLNNVSSPKKGIMGVNCMMVDGFGNLDLGIGAILLNHTDDLNGSELNFFLKLGYRVTPRWGIAYRHISNAGTVAPNTGRDMLFITYSFGR